MKTKLPDLINTSIAADALSVSIRQVQHLIANGVLPATKLGRDYMIRRDDLEKVPKVRKPGPKPKTNQQK